MKKIVGIILFCIAFVACNETHKAKIEQEVMQEVKDVEKDVLETVKPDLTKELEVFPKTMDGYDRYVIVLNHHDDESDMKLDLIPGKTMEVDCNKHFMMGNMTELNLEGFGYNYYKFESNGNINSTLMACPDKKLTEKFIQGQSHTIRYNSKLPVVVFVPKGCELKYQILKPGEMQSATKE